MITLRPKNGTRIYPNYFPQTGVYIGHRGFTAEEKKRFDADFQQIVGLPNYDEEFDKLAAKQAKLLICEWGGFGKEVEEVVNGVTITKQEDEPCTPENVAALVDDDELKMYWYRPITEYLFPTRLKTKPINEQPYDPTPKPEDAKEDPAFLASK